MSQRVTLCGEVKGAYTRSRSESESEKGEGATEVASKSQGVDPKPGELPMARMKRR